MFAMRCDALTLQFFGGSGVPGRCRELHSSCKIEKPCNPAGDAIPHLKDRVLIVRRSRYAEVRPTIHPFDSPEEHELIIYCTI